MKFLVLILVFMALALWANHRWPGHNPPLKPDCRDYWDQVYTLECSR